MDGLRQKTALVEMRSRTSADQHVKEWTAVYKPAKSFLETMPFVFQADLQNKPSVLYYAEQLLKEAYDTYVQTGQIQGATIDELTLVTALQAAVPSPTLALTKLSLKQTLKFQLYRRHIAKHLHKRFKRWQNYLADTRKPIQEIEITKFSGQGPKVLEHEILALKAEGFKLRVKTIPIQEYTDAIEKMHQDPAQDQQMLRILAEDAGIEAPVLSKESLKETLLRFRQEFGLLKGITVTSFIEANERRTPLSKLTELGIAVATTAFVAVGLHHSLKAEEAAGHAVNMVLPFIVSGADKMLLTYFQSPMSALFGQGRSFKFHERTSDGYHPFDKNQLSLPFLVFLNSAAIRFMLTQSTYPAFDLVLMTVNFALFWHSTSSALLSAARGLYSKSPLQMHLEKVREKLEIKRPYSVLLMMSLWQAVWSLVQLGDVYNWNLGVIDTHIPEIGPVNISLRMVMTVLAFVGLGINLKKNANYFKDGARKTYRRLRGFKEPVCEAWLTATIEPDKK